ncbi:hypothetical protein EQV77_11885 [Halobacillus fulvus]|nr:hypothetical protein EQV77_11885 [Halobacillus fulvus]
MNQVIEEIEQVHYKMTNESTKSVEFEHRTNGEVVYLLPNQELTIVLDPVSVRRDSRLKERSTGINHNTSLRTFPKRKNQGVSKIHYGYAFKFQSKEEMAAFLLDIDK